MMPSTKRAAGESGMTLAELMIAMGIMGVLLVAALGFLTSAARTVRTSTQETQSLDDARVTLTRIENELRVAAAVQQTASCPTTATCIALNVPLTAGGIQGVRYRYDSAAKTLYRATGSTLTDTWSTEVPVVKNVVNGSTAVFCRSSSCTTPSDVGATLVIVDVNADPTHPSGVVRLQTYVSPRNL